MKLIQHSGATESQYVILSASIFSNVNAYLDCNCMHAYITYTLFSEHVSYRYRFFRSSVHLSVCPSVTPEKLLTQQKTCTGTFLRHYVMDFTASWHIASTIWVPDAHRVIFRSESKWPPGGEICDFVGSGCPTCGRTFLRHYVMDFSESWHIASTIWVPDARRVIFRSESKWPPGGTICDFLGSGCPTCGGTFLRHYVIDFSES